MTPIFGPRRSSSVLVPTVVPCTIEPMRAAPPSACRPLRKPCASSPRRDGTFAVRNVPRRRIEQEQIGEGAADIDPDDDAALLMVSARAFAVASASSEPSSRSTTL